MTSSQYSFKSLAASSSSFECARLATTTEWLCAKCAIILNERIFPPLFGGYGRRWHRNKMFNEPSALPWFGATPLLQHPSPYANHSGFRPAPVPFYRFAHE